jgi:hypothetical protein
MVLLFVCDHKRKLHQMQIILSNTTFYCHFQTLFVLIENDHHHQAFFYRILNVKVKCFYLEISQVKTLYLDFYDFWGICQIKTLYLDCWDFLDISQIKTLYLDF